MAKKRTITAEEANKLRGIDAYTHDDKKRKNIPPVGKASWDKAPESVKVYKYDPHIDPSLQWAGKQEGNEVRVQTSSIHIHESIKPHKIIKSVQSIGDENMPDQADLFEAPWELAKRRSEAIQFYQHGVNWTNRMIAGDSKVIMNSLLEKEGMANQVQMFYFDPPYGIKYGSNFQPFIGDTSLKSSDRDDDLTQEPEMIKAFRDTWELGIHSYLTYLRDRLMLMREMLADSGSVFVQIGDENVHLVRMLCDEVFGAENYVSQISVKKGSVMFAKKLLNSASFYIIWYAKDKEQIKFNPLFLPKEYQDFADTCGSHLWAENIDTKESIRISPEERQQIDSYLAKHPNYRLFGTWSLNAQGSEKQQGYLYNGKLYYPPKGTQWKTSYPNGLDDLKSKNRLQIEGESLRVKLYYEDYPISRMNNLWTGIGAVNNKIYVVQTPSELIKRCVLMSSDPGDLVMDITCGSGTTAYVAEQWGRRWITCDTSRVSIALAKKRLMTSIFDYYKLAHPSQGVGSGFVYKTAPHVTIGSIVNDEIPATEILYDQPEVEKNKIRITGPFTVEALPAPIVKPVDELSVVDEDHTAKFSDWMEQLKVTGILGRNGSRIEFTSVEPIQGTTFLQAVAETKGDNPVKAVVAFCPETKVMDGRLVSCAIEEAANMIPRPKMVICAAFQFGPYVGNVIESTMIPDMTILKAQMNTDLMTEDLKKNKSSDQSFWLIGQPDVELIRVKRAKNTYKVKVNGFDYYDVKTGEIKSGKATNIAMWMLDTDYDNMCIEPKQVFFPMDGKTDGWNKLAKTLRAEIDQELIEAYQGTESLEFKVLPNSQIAVKIIDDRGIESLKVFKVGE